MTNREPYLKEIDVAAGGLLLRGAGPEQELCVVRRRRYGDVALPKGHPSAGETLAQAALREVREETGCLAAIERIVEPVSYLVGETPKLVVFFLMTLAETGTPTDAEEVAEVLWLRPSEAHGRLSYVGEQALVAQLFGPMALG